MATGTRRADAVPDARVRLIATVFTHVGAVRAGNEDAVAVAERIWAGSMAAPEVVERDVRRPVLALVADGMGGHAAGEVASRAVAEFLVDQADRATDEASVAALLREANEELFGLMRQDRTLGGMGTTVAGLAVTPAHAIVFNVGDSRVYRLEGGTLTQLSTDDTPGPKLANGRTARFTSNLITQTLGGDYVPQQILPHVLTEELAPGRRYLICSDGLTDLVEVAELAALLEDDDAASVAALFEAAMARGGRDNISIVIVRSVREEPERC
jgi:serine/threonine protein phosphatase PrpC